MAINEQPPTSKPPTSTPPTEGYACTARNNRIAFENDARRGAFANKKPDASAEGYNKLFQRIYEEAAEEDKSGMCNPNSTTPNPKYIPSGDLSKMLEETSKRGLNLKYKPDGSLDLSDPDTMQAVVQMGKEGVRVAEAEANKNKPPGESKSGSGSGGGGSGVGLFPSHTATPTTAARATMSAATHRLSAARAITAHRRPGLLWSGRARRQKRQE